jgi:hypothetical protein
MTDPGDKAPPPTRVNEDVVVRVEGIYEVEPSRMKDYPQQDMRVWDTLRIVRGRADFLEWMHGHFARQRWSGDHRELRASGFEHQGFTD